MHNDWPGVMRRLISVNMTRLSNDLARSIVSIAAGAVEVLGSVGVMSVMFQ